MTSPTFDAVLGGFGNKAIDALRVTLGEAWDALTTQERTDCEHLLFTLAKAHLMEVAGFDVSDSLPILSAAFEQWKVVGKQIVASAVKQAASEVFGLAGAFAEGAIAAAIKGAK